MNDSDYQLLLRYDQDHCEEAYAEIVRRYVDLIYSAALRQVRSPSLAEDVAQAVFVDLARNAGRLPPDTVLSAWLYQVARRSAIDVVRSETRRQAREKIAVAMNVGDEAPDLWEEIRPLLDEGMAALSEGDRTAVLLRYFEGKNLREVGKRLGLSEGAAQKRVARAVERLRGYFGEKKIAIGSESLVELVSTRAVVAAPIGLGLTLSSAAAITMSAGTIGAIETIAMTTIQKTIIASTITVVLGAGLYHRQQAKNLAAELAAYRMEMGESLSDLQRAHDEAREALGVSQNENERLRGELVDLPKLRGELAQLRKDSEEFSRREEVASPGESTARDLVDRVSALKDQFEISPESWIPELALVTEEDWIVAATGNMDSEIGLRRAMSRIRGIAENRFGELAGSALKDYWESHDKQFPDDVEELTEFFDDPVDKAILDRWTIADSESVRSVQLGTDFILTQKEAIDEVFDARLVIGPQGRGSTNFRSDRTSEIFWELSRAYQADHGGMRPSDPLDLEPYVRTSAEQKAIDDWRLARSPE